jgi:hypothetical protein
MHRGEDFHVMASASVWIFGFRITVGSFQIALGIWRPFLDLDVPYVGQVTWDRNGFYADRWPAPRQNAYDGLAADFAAE